MVVVTIILTVKKETLTIKRERYIGGSSFRVLLHYYTWKLTGHQVFEAEELLWTGWGDESPTHHICTASLGLLLKEAIRYRVPAEVVVVGVVAVVGESRRNSGVAVNTGCLVRKTIMTE